MTTISIDYTGQLHCQAEHDLSGRSLETDAPVDNNGLGQSFSPTDLVATALGSCMATVMGIAASQRGYDLKGMAVTVNKHMSEDLPRRIVILEVCVTMPLPEDHVDRDVLEKVAHSCPVYHSLSSDIEVPISWRWQSK